MDDETPWMPRIESAKLDLSQAHFLDHSIWACGRRPVGEAGGRRRHLAHAWEYKWKPELRAWTVCRVGLHHFINGWEMKDGQAVRSLRRCRDCGDE